MSKNPNRATSSPAIQPPTPATADVTAPDSAASSEPASSLASDVAEALRVGNEVTAKAAEQATKAVGPDAAPPPSMIAGVDPLQAHTLVHDLAREFELDATSSSLLAAYLLLSSTPEDRGAVTRARELARQPVVWVTIRQANPLGMALALERCNLPVVGHQALQRAQNEIAAAAA